MTPVSFSPRKSWRIRLGNIAGACSIFLSNILAVIVLHRLRICAPSPSDRTGVLALANLVAALPLLLFGPRDHALLIGPNSQSRLVKYSIIGWSAAYCIIYGAFVVLRDSISLSMLFVAQSLAPTLSIIFARKLQPSPVDSNRDWPQFLTILPLLLIAANRWSPSSNLAILSHISTGGLLIVMFTFSQTCSRFAAGAANSFWAQPRLSLLNGIFLSIALLVTVGPEHMFPKTVPHIQVVELGLGIAILQVLYLFGVRISEPHLSALAYSSCIPISLIAENILDHAPIDLNDGALSLIYCCAIAFQTVRARALVKDRRVLA